MKHSLFVTFYLLVMGAVIIGADVLFLRDHFWARLGTNAGIVIVFAVVYLAFLRRLFE